MGLKTPKIEDLNDESAKEYLKIFSFMENNGDAKEKSLGSKERNLNLVPINKPNGDQTLSTMKSETLDKVKVNKLRHIINNNDNSD